MKPVSLECPRCTCSVKALVDPDCVFVLYKCQKCKSNVVFYEGKVDVISDQLIIKLLARKKFRLQSNKKSSNKTLKQPTVITEEQIENLRHLMATEKDFNSFLNKI